MPGRIDGSAGTRDVAELVGERRGWSGLPGQPGVPAVIQRIRKFLIRPLERNYYAGAHGYSQTEREPYRILDGQEVPLENRSF